MRVVSFVRSFVVIGGLGAAALPMQAQMIRIPNADAPRMLVATPRSADKKLSAAAADALTGRFSADIPFRTLWVLPRADVTRTLDGSGYPVDEALSSDDVNRLAKLLKTDEYIESEVTKTETGYRIEAKLVLAKDQELQQPLIVAEADKLDKAAAIISRDLQEARKQLSAEKSCEKAIKEGKWDVAITAARNGATAYPRATISRICEMNAVAKAGKPSAEVKAAAGEILKIDPKSPKALAADASGDDK
jgi:hypothetical protein